MCDQQLVVLRVQEAIFLAQRLQRWQYACNASDWLQGRAAELNVISLNAAMTACEKRLQRALAKLVE